MSMIDRGRAVSRFMHITNPDNRIGQYKIGTCTIGRTIIIFFGNFEGAVRVRLFTGSPCEVCPNVVEGFAMSDTPDECRRFLVCVCHECAKHLFADTEWNEVNCKCRSLCQCEACQEIAAGSKPEISVVSENADEMLTDDEAQEAGVDPERRLVPRAASPANTIAYGTERSPSPTVFTGAAVGRSVDAQEALSILTKEFDESRKKDRKIAMLERKVQELKMQTEDLQTRSQEVTVAVNTFLQCSVFPDEDPQNKMFRGVCGHILSSTAVEGMLRVLNVVAAEPPVLLTCPVCRHEGLWSELRNLDQLLRAIGRLNLPLLEFVEAPSANPGAHAYNSPPESP